MTTVKEYIKTLLKLAINNNPEVLKVIRNSKAVVQNFAPNQPRVPKGNPNGGQFAGSNKSHYASYNDFVNEFSDYIEDVPEDYEISDVEEALKDLGITKDKPLKISNSYETVNVTCESIRHIVGGGGDGHEPDTSRYKSINKMLATLKDPNLITEDENGKKRYFKLFDDKNKVKHQFVILFDENDIPTVYTTMPVNKDKKYFLNQVNAGKPVYKKGQTGVIKNSAADIIITDIQEDFNPDMKKNEVFNDKWITIHPNGEDSKGRPLLLKDGESPKEAIERSYKSSTKLKESSSEHPETNTLRKLLISNPKDEHYSRLFDLAQRGRERGKLARLIACKRSVNRRSGTFIVSNQTGEVYKKASKCVSRKEATNRVFLGTAMFLFQSTLPQGERRFLICS